MRNMLSTVRKKMTQNDKTGLRRIYKAAYYFIQKLLINFK